LFEPFCHVPHPRTHQCEDRAGRKGSKPIGVLWIVARQCPWWCARRHVRDLCGNWPAQRGAGAVCQRQHLGGIV